MLNKLSMNSINTLNKRYLFLWVWCTTVSISPLPNKHIAFSTHKNNDLSQEITCTFHLNKNDFLYKNFIVFSVDHPSVTLSQWESNNKTAAYYDPLFKNTKHIFNTTATLSLTATAQTNIDKPVHLYCSYYQRSAKKIKQVIYPLAFTTVPVDQDSDYSLDNFTKKNNHHSPHYRLSLIDRCFTAFLSYLAYIAHTYGQAHGVQCFFIIILLILCIIPPYFFTKKIHISSQLHELAAIISETLCCIIIGCILYSIHFFIWTWTMNIFATIYTFSVGIFYIKKSAKLQWNYLRTLCSIIGVILTSSSMLCLFKTLQQLSAAF